MKLNSIKTKLTLALGVSGLIVLGVLISLSTMSAKNKAIESALENALSIARDYAGGIEAKMEKSIGSARTLARAFSAVKAPLNQSLEIDRDSANAILRTVLKSNEFILGIGMLWEPGEFDLMDAKYAGQAGYDETGRFLPYWTKDGKGGAVLECAVGYHTEGIGDYYLIPKKTMNEVVTDPYPYPVQGKDVLVTTLVAPIVYEDKFYGIIGMDVPLMWLQKMVDSWNLSDGKALICIISNNGILAAVSGQRSLVGKHMKELEKDFEKSLPDIKAGNEIIKFTDKYLEVLSPLKIGNTKTPWSVNIKIPSELITAEASSQMWEQISVSATLSGLTLLFVIFLVNRLIRPLGNIAGVARNLALGDLEFTEIKTADDEIGVVNASFRDVTSSLQEITSVCEAIAIGDFSKSVRVRSKKDGLGKAVNQMIEDLKKVIELAEMISKGDYSVEIEKRSEDDRLSVALNRMTKTLREATEEREKENWFKTGQMELNETIRGENDIIDLSRSIITSLCGYLGAKIGAFYVTDDGKSLSLIGTYAYQKRKNLSNEFRIGEGLVGQAALEKKHISITNCPDDYIRVYSGLGEAVPHNILVFPFLLEDRVKAVAELGSFHPLSDLDLAFLDQVAESVAIALNSAQSRTQMATLLKKTQDQAEALEAQQEKLREANEGLEEQTDALRESESWLQVQQEDLQKANKELEKQTHALKESEAELQAQQEELQQTNEELEEQAQLLETQKEDTQRKNIELEKARNLIEEKAKDLEMASKYKSEFLANMSHELRTPLNSILLLSKLLSDNRDNNLSEKQVEFADNINSSGSDLLGLINEILDLSKVESGKMDIHIDQVDLNDFAGNMERNFGPVAKEKGLGLDINLSDDLPDHIRTDRQRIEQIAKNLLSNAFKFTSKGGVTLRISRSDDNVDLSSSGLDTKSSISFSVIDTGEGIPKDKIQLIFESFRQADGTTSRRFGGSGLGLSISKELSRLLGGEIHLESEVGKGSVFTLYLPEVLERALETPLTPPQKPTETGDIASSPPAQVNGQAGQPVISPTKEPTSPPLDIEIVSDDRRDLSPNDKSILIIEDDPKFAKILRDLSREKGFKVLIAGDGETGLHFADYYKPSAVILDIGLPGMDGWTVMSRLKDNPETRHLPVHFITGSEKSLDAMKMGAIGFFTKPVSMEEVEQVYRRIEQIISKPTKNLLVVEYDEAQRKAIIELIGNGDVLITAVPTGKEAYDQLTSGSFDCIILDPVLPDMSGDELLSKIKNNEEIYHIPIIVYSGRELAKQEEITLNEYAESIVIKGVKSPERLLDEASLFLHRVEANLPEEKREMLRMIHDKELILKDKKILVVEDDMRTVFALTNILEDRGMKVVIGKNGKEGLEHLDKNADVNLILMDIMMPQMDGYEAMREIRKQERFRKLPIIALTAKAMKGDRAKCIEAGANDYLAKPLDTEKLLSMLRVWLYQ